MLRCKAPHGCEIEKSYIIKQVFEARLGLTISIEFDQGTDFRISMGGETSVCKLPNYFFSNFTKKIDEKSLVGNFSDEFWYVPKHLKSTGILGTTLPKYFRPQVTRIKDKQASYVIPIDIFGICFFLLSRMEEYNHNVRDKHDRFSAYNSVNYKLGVLHRPIVDEVIELLWNYISRQWPKLRRKEDSFAINVSHDVDHPSRYKFCNRGTFIKRSAKDILVNGKVRPVFHGLRSRIDLLRDIPETDPFNNFTWIMHESEKRGLQSTFFFMCDANHFIYDPDYDINSPSLKTIMKNIDSRGHILGVHPSYMCFDNSLNMKNEVYKWRSIIKANDLTHGKMISRMHYLRFNVNISPLLMEQSGIEEDYTLGFADCAGFRAGTSKDFQFFSITERRELDLIMKPLCAMEASVLSYMGKSHSEAYDYFIKLKRACERVGGVFSLLWHNSHLVSGADRELYLSTISNA